MDFADQIRELASKLDTIKVHVSNEEATKVSLVMPFLQVLGYDVFDPTEVIPEFTAEIKKGEKVDYAIAFGKDKEPKILIEVKNVKSILQIEAINKLLGYFFSVTKTAFAILTNGIQYQFFSDLEKKNVMDTTPFLIVDIVPSIRDQEIAELKRFHKSYFNAEEIITIARELKYTGEIKRYLKQQFKDPDESFIKLIIKKTSYPGIATKQLVDRFSSIFHNAFKQYLNETISNTLKDTIEKTDKGKIGSTEVRDILRHRFWKQLLTLAKTKTDLHSKISPGQDSWCGMGAGTSGLGYNYVIFQHQARVELYIDKGEHSKNKEIFDRLVAAKEGIEQSFGGPLEWERIEGRRACRIKKDLTLGGYRDDEQKWPKIHEAMVDAMIRFHKAISPHIQYLKK